MNEIDIRRINMDHAADANIPNEPFFRLGPDDSLLGAMKVELCD